jgi:hypothetical protein
MPLSFLPFSSRVTVQDEGLRSSSDVTARLRAELESVRKAADDASAASMRDRVSFECHI